MSYQKPSARLPAVRPGVLAFATLLSATPALANVHELEEMQITGAAGSERAYYQPQSSVARSDTPSFEVPQAIQVISRQVIDDTGATRLSTLFDYVSGVSRQNDFGGLWDNFSVRGFSGHINTGPNVLRNGFAGNRGYNAPRDLANVERAEFLKGPASALYGSAEPGGILNIVTKKPQFDAAHTAQASAASYDSYRTAFDSTAPLSDSLAYRMNIAYEDKGSFRDHIDSERVLLAPSFTWQIAPGTVLDYDAEFLRHEAPMDRGVLAFNGRVGALPRERFLGEPGDGDTVIENLTHQLTLQHELSDNWSGRVGLSYRTTSLEGDSTQVWPSNPMVFVPAGSTEVRRERRYRDYSSDDIAFQSELRGTFRTGDIAHEVVTGLDSYRFTLDEFVTTSVRPLDYPLDIYQPVYGQPLPATSNPHTNTREVQRSTGLFVQDQISLSSDWRLLLGLRHENFRKQFENRRTGVRISQEDGVTTPRIGLTWLVSPNVSLYTLASESFRPNSGASASGATFDPEEGRSKEIGVKYESSDKRYGATLAVFEIEKQNVLTNDPAAPGFSIAAGEARSRGAEIDLSGQLTEQLRAIANYAYTDARITEDNNAALVGARLVNSPRHSGAVLLMYEDDYAGGRFGLGGGLNYVGQRGGNAADTFSLPGYTTARLMAHWQPRDELRLSLEVDNLFDETYYASSYDIYWITPGAPRTLTVGAQYRL